MDSLIEFITVLAWIFGIGATVLIVIRILGWYVYSPIEKHMDALRGIKVSFPVVKPGVIAIICWSWILVF